jgi:hypothetical protein
MEIQGHSLECAGSTALRQNVTVKKTIELQKLVRDGTKAAARRRTPKGRYHHHRDLFF